jgi:flagellar capping protein FliD
MSDIYVPGVRSRFNNEKIVEDLMKLERVPKERAEKNIERIETEKAYWQEIGRRTNSLRDSARQLFSFQNPFNDRTVNSSDEAVLSATAVREATEQERTFTVKQLAQTDRFLSKPLEEDFHVESGTYIFSIGKEEISFEFRGGTLNDFTDALNRRGRDKLQSSLIAVKSGTKSLLIESKVTGEENSLGFSGEALSLGEKAGMIKPLYDEEGTLLEIMPLNAVSKAQDAIVSMEGIEVSRPENQINDLIPGVTITVKSASDRPVRLLVESDQEGVKDAIITMVGNYNRLMAEINILTRNDDRVIEELSYLTKDEKDEYRKRLGSFSADSTLAQMRSTLMRIVTAPYQTSEDQDLTLLAQIGIGSDIRRSGGTDSSRLRGYLEIDEKVLDEALASKLTAVRQLFGSDTTGDLIVNSGIAYSIEALTKPYTEIGGLFALKTGSLNSRIDQEKRRIVTLDRQLAAKEAELKKQYGQMEGAFTRMEQLSTSFDRFQQQNNNNSR